MGSMKMRDRRNDVPVSLDVSKCGQYEQPTDFVDDDTTSVAAMLATRNYRVRDCATLVILFIVNLLNYMDRFTVAGVLTQIQAFFSIEDAQAGLIQTVFIVFYMIFAPVCGFLGDRYNRKWIMTVGISVWLLAVLASSFAQKNHFWLFLLMRGIVGVGEASYATIAPTIIADIFALAVRSRALMFFYFAIPVGSGLGYIASSNMSTLLGGWQWGIRITAILGVLALILIISVMKEPKRGAAEKAVGATGATDIEATSYWKDIKAICQIPTYLSSTIAYTSVVFVTGTLSWWAPAAIDHASAMMETMNSTSQLPSSKKNEITFKFGLITVIGGIVGVSLGTFLAQIWQSGKFFCKPFKTERANPLVCAIGSAVGVPSLFLGLHLIVPNLSVAWVCFFVTIVALCLNWAVNVDMLLDIIVPQRRSTANSWQILISHLFGDATGPYIIGLVSDALRGKSETPAANFYSLLTAFYIPNALLIISAVLFFVAAAFFVRDKRVCRGKMGYNQSTSNATYNGKQITISCVSGVANDAFS